MKKTLLSVLLGLFFLPLIGQKTVTLAGYVEDAESKERLISAAVYYPDGKTGVVTNIYGFYAIEVPQNKPVMLKISYTGYQTDSILVNLKNDVTLTFQLKSILMEEVVISSKKDNKIEERVQMGQIAVPIKQIKHIPALLGEVDVLKALQFLPGVQGGGEGQNGLYVRGGSPDQNLILLDGVPVYNASHLGGFFSVFNGDAIKGVTLTKSGFPARYGGRLSSVIDITMKEGNMQEFHGEGGIGVIASRLLLEGPIVKNKASFMVSARRTYLDVLARPVIKQMAGNDNDFSVNPTLYFYDLNTKINYNINDKHRVYLSGYFGKDIFAIDQKDKFQGGETAINSGTNWGNATVAARWNYLISNKLFANTTLTYSRYNFNFLAEVTEKQDTNTDIASAKYVSGIEDYAARTDFDYLPNNNHHIRFGAGITNHTYNPGALAILAKVDNINIADTTLGASKSIGNEPFMYVEDELRWRDLRASVGLHASAFATKGKTYYSVQPRIGVNYSVPNVAAFKASFATMQQYINLLTNESFSLPTDLWVPSTAKVKPQQSWQASVGVAKTVKDWFEVTIEGYYKEMKNVLSYREGASFTSGLFGGEANWEDRVTQGKGKAYGAEFLIQKSEGKTTGWIGYTLSWNLRTFDNENPELRINSGLEFPYKYDRRHDFEAVVTHSFSKRITATIAWVYGTGNAITPAIGSFRAPSDVSQGGAMNPYFENFNIYGAKNSVRMRAYHRLDFNIEFTKKKKYFTRIWSVGAYNAYSRANPYFITANQYTLYDKQGKPLGEKFEYNQISLFPIIPSISYGFKF